MATTGLSRVTCSICLEPYKGRCPKILPCFHTFCLPCLTQLEESEKSLSPKVSVSTQGDEGESDVPSPVTITITCPACRTPIPLPQGGVAYLQTNFYLDDGGDQSDPRPLLCDLCEEGQEVKYTCTQCLSNFCSRCRRLHDKCCKSVLVSEVMASCGSGAGLSEGSGPQDQLKMVQDVLKKLEQEEERLAREKRAREHDIHVRYATLLSHAGEAHDASLVSLRDVTQALNDALQSDVTLARGVLHRMKQSATECQGSCSSFSESEDLTEAKRDHFQELLQKKEADQLVSEVEASCGSRAGLSEGSGCQDQLKMVQDVLKKLAQEEERLARKKRAKEHDINVRYATLLSHAGEARDASLVSLRDVTQALSDALQSGVTLSRGVLHRMEQSATECQASCSSFSESEDLTEANRHHFEELLQEKEEEALLNYEDLGVSSTQSLIRDFRDFMSRVVAAGQFSANPLDTDMTGRVASDPQLQASDGAVTAGQSTTEHTPDVGQAVDVRDLASKVEHLTSRCSLTENLAASLQTQNASLCADLASVRDKNSRLCADIAALQREMASLRDSFGDDLTSMKRDIDSVEDKNDLLGQENQQLGGDMITLQTDQTKFQAEQDKLWADQDKLQAEQDKLRADQDKLQADQDKLKADHDKLKADHDKLQKDHNSFAAVLGTMKNDVRQVNPKNSKMDLDIASVQDSLNRDSISLTSLETRLSRSNVQVAFHAILSETVSTADSITLVCDQIITNVGGGYDGETGVFTAPVSGLYCFLSTSGPVSDDSSVRSVLRTVLDDRAIGYLGACGNGKCTVHITAQVNAGQKVWLRTDGFGEKYVFNGNPTTSFTGMLLQAEM